MEKRRSSAGNATRQTDSWPAQRSFPYKFMQQQRVLNARSTGTVIVNHYLQQDCVLAPEELKRLAAHQYSAVDTSWLDELCMKAFWERVVEFCPLWVAPNLITLVGLLINMATILILSYYSPSAKEDAPRWAYFISALGLFIYQTLDAIDGKQARRTKSSSPLGELFDHGCDSVSQIFISLNVCYALQLGQMWCGVFAMCALSAIVFYTAHWSAYCTGQLRFARFDVTEAEMSVILILLLTSIFGPGLWSIGIYGVQLKHLLAVVALPGALYQLGGYLFTIMTQGSGRNGSTVAGTSVLFPLCPILAVVVPFMMIYSKSESDVLEKNITVFAFFFGVVAAKATQRLILAHMSKSSLVLWDWTYIGPAVMILNQYYDHVFSEETLLYICAFYSFASMLLYCVMITRQICTFLGIRCFKITPKE